MTEKLKKLTRACKDSLRDASRGFRDGKRDAKLWNRFEKHRSKLQEYLDSNHPLTEGFQWDPFYQGRTRIIRMCGWPDSKVGKCDDWFIKGGDIVTSDVTYGYEEGYVPGCVIRGFIDAGLLEL